MKRTLRSILEVSYNFFTATTIKNNSLLFQFIPWEYPILCTTRKCEVSAKSQSYAQTSQTQNTLKRQKVVKSTSLLLLLSLYIALSKIPFRQQLKHNVLLTLETNIYREKVYMRILSNYTKSAMNIFLSFPYPQPPSIHVEREYQELPPEVKRWNIVQNKTSLFKILHVSYKKGWKGG